MLIDPLGGPRRSWDRLGSALFSSCGLTSIFGRFGGLLEVHLGSFWAFGKASWGRFGVSGCILVLFGAAKKHLLIDSTHQLINSSTHQLINPSTHRFNRATQKHYS